MPSVDESMTKLPPAASKDDHPEGAKDKYSEEDQKKAETQAKRKAKAEEQVIIKRAVKRFKRASEAESDNRSKALEDLKFKAGDQWPADIAGKRKDAKRPCLTINGLPTLTHQVSNDIRQNRPAINVSPLGDEATKEASEIIASWMRAVERDSAADIAYDTAITLAVDIGFGYWRLLTEFESDDSLDQVLVIRRIRNPFTVLLDPKRQEPDGSDSRYGFVSEMVDRDDFKDQWPDARLVPWKEAGVGQEFQEWVTKDEIRVAEYFEVNHELKRLVRLSNGHEGYWNDLSDAVKADISKGKLEIIDERDADIQVVEWYRMTCAEILEQHRWPGKWIPIPEVIGEEIDIEGKVIRSGIIRNAKDPMRMKNYAATAKAESVALVTKAPWVAPEGSFLGYEDEWDKAVNENVSRLEYVPQSNEQGQPLPGPQRQPPAQIPAGWAEIEKTAEQDLLRTTGVSFDGSIAERLYDESGKAQRERRRDKDVGSFHFSDNLSRTMRHSGRMMLDLFPKLMNRKRMVPILAEDGKDSRVMIDPTHVKPVGQIPGASPNQPPIKVLNPTLGKYGVTITIGPSYATKRIEAQEQMMAFAKALPEQGRLIAHLIAKYSDWPGSNEVYAILLKALPPNLQAPDMKDIPPQIAAFVQSLSQQIAKLMAERTTMLKDLTDKKEDRKVVLEGINKTFEAKVLKLFTDIKRAADKNDIEVLRALLGADELIKAALGVPAGAEATAEAAPSGPAGQPSPAGGGMPNNVIPMQPGTGGD